MIWGGHSRITVRGADLSKPETLYDCLDGADLIVHFAAEVFEIVSKIFHTKSPLTKDFIDIGRVSYYGDTSRFRSELLPSLKYATINEGVKEMSA